MNRFKVRLTQEADLLGLFDFLLEQDAAAAEVAREAITKSVELLEVFAFSCRKAPGGDGSPFLRDLIVPFGRSDCVVRFEIENQEVVTLLAVRHQREKDYR